MATFEDVVIRVTERGAKEAANSIGEVGKASESAAGAVASLNRVMYSLLGAFSVKTLIDYTDKFQAMGNQIKLVTKNSEDFNKVQERLFSMAQNNRVGISELTELYTKLAMSQKEVGVSGEQLYKVVDVISKAISVSGRSGQAAANGLRQFVQGLVSGKVQGEELRSVLENTPYLAKVLADGLRVPVGALRELGAQGKLTSQTVVNALLNMTAAVDKEFAKTDITVSQSFTILDNAFTKFIGQSGSASGASKLLASSIVLLAQNLDKVVLGVIGLTAAWIGYRIAVTAVAAAQWLANAAIAANPIVRVVVIIASAIALLVAFTTEWKTIVAIMTTAGTTAVEVFNMISGAVVTVIKWFTDLNASINKTASDFGAGFIGAFTAIGEYIGGWVTWFTELVTVTIPGVWNSGIEAIKKFFVDGFNYIKDFLKGIVDTIKGYIDSFVSGAMSLINSVINAAKSAANALKSLGGGGKSEVSGARAAGGPVTGGKTYLVGENGPELFSPSSNGSIIPNGGSGQQMAAASSGTNYNPVRMLETALHNALDEQFKSLRAIGNETNVRLDKLIELGGKTASATTSLNNSVQDATSGGKGTASGTSDINNFGLGPMAVKPATVAPVASSGGGGGAMSYASAGPSKASTPQAPARAVDSYLRELMNLNQRYVNNSWMNDASPQTSFALQAVKSFISTIPADLKDQVIAAARRERGPVLAGYPMAFRTGGQFTVPGGTGVDSKVIPIRATPGEQVNVRTRKQVRDEEGARETSGGNTYIFQVSTPDANSFRQSETQVMREFLRKASAAQRS